MTRTALACTVLGTWLVFAAGADAQLPPGDSGLVRLGDGIEHVIDADASFPYDAVVVEPGPDGTLTTVRVAFRGEVGAGLEARGRTRVEIEEGARIGLGLVAGGESEVEIVGGTVSGDLVARSEARVRVLRGVIAKDLEAEDASRVEMSGGRVGDDLQLEGSAQATLRGGTIADRIEVRGSARLEIAGRDFNRPYGPVGPRAGRLRGTLADGSALDQVFHRGPAAEIVLVEAAGE